MDQTFEHDPELAAHLRDSAGRDWNEDAAEDERLTALHDRRRFGLSEMAKDMANRGERVTVEYGGHTFSGAVVAAGANYVTLEGSGLRADIRLDAGYWSVLVTDADSRPGVVSIETLTARLAEYAESGLMVRLAIPDGNLVIGKVTVVADDHIELADADGRKLYVPLKMILAITRSIEFH